MCTRDLEKVSHLSCKCGLNPGSTVIRVVVLPVRTKYYIVLYISATFFISILDVWVSE